MMKRFKKQISFLLAVWMLAALLVPVMLTASAEAGDGESANEVAIIGADQSVTEFATFAELFGIKNDQELSLSAAQIVEEGDTIKLLKDVTLPTKRLIMDINGISIDGNGKTIYAGPNFYGDPYIRLTSAGDVTVDNLRILTSSRHGCPDAHIDVHPLSYAPSNENSSLTMNNVEISAPANETFRIFGKATVTLNNCTFFTWQNSCIQIYRDAVANLYINGGYYYTSTDSKENAPYALIRGGDENCKVIINGGTFEAYDRPVFYIGCPVTAYGGTYITEYKNYVEWETGKTPAIEMIGSHFVSKWDNKRWTTLASETEATLTAVTYSALVKNNEMNGTLGSVLAPDGNTYKTTARPIDVLDGASVRLVPGSNGIRFTSLVKKADLDSINAIKDADTEVTFGTLIAPTEHVTGLQAFTMDTLNQAGIAYQNVVATSEGIVTYDNGDVEINAAMIDIKPDNIARDFSAVSYIQFIKNGQKTLIYAAYDATSNSRNIRSVAEAALNDITVEYTDDQFSVLNEYAMAEDARVDKGILGNAASKYTIVLSSEHTYAEERFARRLQGLIAAKYSTTLPIVKDDDAGSITNYEILVGNTARTTGTMAEGTFAFTLTAVENRLEILADNVYSYEYAFNYCNDDKLAIVAAASKNDGLIYTGDVKALMDADDISSVYKKEGSIRLMNFNTLGFGFDAEKYGLKNKTIYEMIQTISPDIITLEELVQNNRDDAASPVAPRLIADGYAEAYTQPITYQNGTLAPSAIFYRTEVFDLLESGCEILYTENGTRSDNVITWAVLQEKATGRKIAVVCMHLYSLQDANSNAERLQQTETLLTLADTIEQKYSCAVIMAGDMNCNIESDPFKKFESEGFVDLASAAENGDTGPTHYHEDPVYKEDTGVFERPNLSVYPLGVDHIIARGDGVEYKQFDVLRDDCSSMTSDHMPLVLDFNLVG